MIKYLAKQIPYLETSDFLLNNLDDIPEDIIIFGNPHFIKVNYDNNINEIYVESDNSEDFLKHLSEYKNKKYLRDTISGYSQSDWTHIYYPEDTPKEVIKYIEDVFFGKYDEYLITPIEDDVSDRGFVFEHDDRPVNEILAEYVGCSPDEIKVLKIKSSHIVYDYEEV